MTLTPAEQTSPTEENTKERERKMILMDHENGVAYVPVSFVVLEEWKDWSEPVQIRWQDGYDTVEVRSLGQPVKGVYIVPGEEKVGASA